MNDKQGEAQAVKKESVIQQQWHTNTHCEDGWTGASDKAQGAAACAGYWQTALRDIKCSLHPSVSRGGQMTEF